MRCAFSTQVVNARLAHVAAAVIGFTAVWTPASALGASEPRPFCNGVVVRDYLKPLKRLPALRKPPAELHLPFGPRAVQLLSSNPLQVGAGEIGFSLAYDALPRRLDWLVTAKLTQISAGGDAFGKLETRQVKVERPSRGTFDDFFFTVSAEPALYRIEIVFRNKSNRKLGAYGEYFRVVPSRQDARLRLNATSYRPEKTVYARIENLGTVLVTYGVPYSIEWYDGSSWVKAPESPKGPWILPLLFSQPGTSGNCFGFTIPAEMAPGLYRFVKSVNYSTESRRAGRRAPVTLTAKFEVLPPS
jgi:hypothetical protein